MAELISLKPKKQTPRIDLTPMVDLGFLLITFFIFTTTLIEKNTLEISMPKIAEPPTEVADFATMVCYLDAQNTCYYFSGQDALNNKFDKLKKGDFSSNKIREILLQHQEYVRNAYKMQVKGAKQNDEPFIIIKPMSSANYATLVDMLDEMQILNLKTYAVVDIDASEEKKVLTIPKAG
ncbi:MAG: biopolymer transporter ExbD [Chitinophagaceae bacterium]